MVLEGDAPHYAFVRRLTRPECSEATRRRFLLQGRRSRRSSLLVSCRFCQRRRRRVVRGQVRSRRFGGRSRFVYLRPSILGNMSSPVSDGGSSRLVDDSEDVETSDCSSILRRLSLGVVEVWTKKESGRQLQRSRETERLRTGVEHSQAGTVWNGKAVDKEGISFRPSSNASFFARLLLISLPICFLPSLIRSQRELTMTA